MVDMTSFRRWVGEQPPECTYDYWHTGTLPGHELCAMGQYLREQFPDSRVEVVIGLGMVHGVGVINIPRDVEQALSGVEHRDSRELHTFGGLAKRLAQLEDA